MSSRFFAAIAAAFLASLVVSGCGGSLDLAPIGVCIKECPGELIALERCPAFTSCEIYDGCHGEPLICAPRDEGDQQNQDGDDQPYDCSAPLQCPATTTEVASCPDGELCTRISYCNSSILCLENASACQEAPLCPDGERPLDGIHCDEDLGESCYRNMHCSGPVLCLRCDGLPESCPEEHFPLSAEECEDRDEPCLKVETCEETLFCAPESASVCEEELQCPGDSVPRDDCEGSDDECLILEGCGGPLSCGAPPNEAGCDALPSCPEGYGEFSFARCSSRPDECLFVAECGNLIACLPN